MLPIVERELLVAARKRLAFWSRITAAGTAFLVVFIVVGLTPAAAGPSVGAVLFRWLSGFAFYGCLVGGALLTADSLSRERREGTLPLLSLTDMTGRDVLLGKLRPFRQRPRLFDGNDADARRADHARRSDAR